MSYSIGQEISTPNTCPTQWWSKESGFKYGKSYPLILTGTITRICKNGAIWFACNEMRNNSSDGRTTTSTHVSTLLDNWTPIK